MFVFPEMKVRPQKYTGFEKVKNLYKEKGRDFNKEYRTPLRKKWVGSHNRVFQNFGDFIVRERGSF